MKAADSKNKTLINSLYTTALTQSYTYSSYEESIGTKQIHDGLSSLTIVPSSWWVVCFNSIVISGCSVSQIDTNPTSSTWWNSFTYREMCRCSSLFLNGPNTLCTTSWSHHTNMRLLYLLISRGLTMIFLLGYFKPLHRVELVHIGVNLRKWHRLDAVVEPLGLFETALSQSNSQRPDTLLHNSRGYGRQVIVDIAITGMDA